MKKRVFVLITALICLFALASCENETAYSLYSGSVEKLNAAGGYEMNADVDIAITIGSQTVEGSMQMNLKANGNNAAMDYSMDMMDNKVDMSVAYVDGVAYTEMSGVKYKAAVSEEELESDGGMASFELPEMTEDALKDIELTEDGDNRSFTVTLTGDDVNSFWESIGSVADSLAEMGADIDFGDLTFTCTFDKDSNMTDMKVDITYIMDVSGQEASVAMSLDYDFVNIGTAPTITAPADADSYIDADSLM